jgi:ribonuclease E
VNYGADRNGFLPLSDIHPEYFSNEIEEPVRIQDVIHPGQEVLVQVVKEEIGNKGALLTTYISLAGRDVVLMPGQSQRGISRKIEDEAQRERLRTLVNDLALPEEIGIILRTAAEHRTKRDIVKDSNHLMKMWEEIKKQVEDAPAPALIHKDQDLALRVLRDYFNPRIKTILVDDRDVCKRVKEFLHIISPEHQRAVKLYKDEGPITNKFNLEDQIEQIFHKRIPLKSGGSLFIDSTEALVAIDVNSGRTNGNGVLEEMVYKVNMEAAVEIPRQLRLRDLGGLIVVDFIDMRDSRHAREVERRFREEVKKDKAKITVGRISRFGLLELSRQHLGLSIMRGSFGECPMCRGTGLVRSVEAQALSNLRKIWLTLSHKKAAMVRATFNVEVANYLLNRKRTDLIRLEERYGTSILIEGSPSVLPQEGHVEYVAGDTP